MWGGVCDRGVVLGVRRADGDTGGGPCRQGSLASSSGSPPRLARCAAGAVPSRYLPPWPSAFPQLVLAQKRLDARQIFLRGSEPAHGFSLPGGELKTQPKYLFGKLALTRRQFRLAQIPQLIDFPGHQSSPARLTNRV